MDRRETRTKRCLESPVYLDTCIVSGLAKGDLPRREHRALNSLLRDHRRGHLVLATSEVTEAEIEAIPERYRFAHSAICGRLAEIPSTYYWDTPEQAPLDPNFWLFERLS